MINAVIAGMHQPLHAVHNIRHPSRRTVLVGNDPYLLPCLQAVLDQLQDIPVLSGQRLSIDDNHTDDCIITAYPGNCLFSLILGQSIIVDRSRNIFLRIKPVAFPVEHEIGRQMNQAASQMFTTMRQVPDRRNIGRISLFAMLLAVIGDRKG